MLTLNSRLNTIGISTAKGVDVPMLRDQLNSTLPTAGSSASTTKPEATTKQEATAEARTQVATAKTELSQAEQRQVRELQQIDRAVRAHEQAHLSAGRGVVTSGVSFTYTYGPDGKQYAIGGEVGIDTSPEREPEENIDKGIRIQEAALAPRDPSPQDYQVAAVGSRLEGQGRSDLVRQQQQETIAAEAAAAEQRKAASEEAAAAVPEIPSGGKDRLVRDAYQASAVAESSVNTFA